MEVEGGYGSNLVKLDIHKVLLLKEMKMKDRRIEELTQQQVARNTRPILISFTVVSFPGRNWRRFKSEYLLQS